MRYPIIFCLLVLLCACSTGEYKGALFLINDNHRFGYIDTVGNIVINPRFPSAGEFSEGLAAARINGIYGYINSLGDFVIQPQFDFATPFYDGAALVYKENKSFYIDKSGKRLFEFPFESAGNFKNNRALVRTFSGKLGIINKEGHLIIDTAFRYIGKFINGHAVVTGFNDNPYADEEKKINEKFESGIVDSLGRFVVPYGRYRSIDGFDGQYFEAVIPRKHDENATDQTVITDISGKIYLSDEKDDNCSFSGVPKFGLVKMSLYKNWLKEEDETSWSSDKAYDGFMSLSGKLVINDTTYSVANDFHEGFSFIIKEDFQRLVIDTTGNLFFKDFEDVLGEGFKNGKAFVSIDGKWGLIDRNFHFIIKPKFDQIDPVGIMNDIFFFSTKDDNTESEYDVIYGIGSVKDDVVLNPMMQNFDRAGFKNGLLNCVIDNRTAYVNRKGEIVWHKSENELGQSELDIDFMNRGYFYAYSEPVGHAGGFGGSGNIPNSISKPDNLEVDSLTIIVRPVRRDTLFHEYEAEEVLIVNGSNKKIQFYAQDSRLYMKVQALSKEGIWKDIEYLPSSWCGNSYHTLILNEKKFWSFLTPKYHGDFKTKLRIELKYLDPDSKEESRYDKKEFIVYSNEYEGSVNPGQFWRKQEYFPQGIMDPYYD